MEYTIGGHTFNVRDQAAQAVWVIQGVKGIIDQAVKASPEASLIWAGVCAVLPILTNSSIAEEANKTGFTYVTARIRFYVALEPLLLPKESGSGAVGVVSPTDVVAESLMNLYQHILEFQLRSVLRFYRRRRGNLVRDSIKWEDWKVMLDKIEKLEATLSGDFSKAHGATLVEKLKEINETANKSREAMQGLLSVAEKQLEVSEEQKNILMEILDELRLMNKQLPSSDSQASHTLAEADEGWGGRATAIGNGFQLEGGRGGRASLSFGGKQDYRSIGAQGGQGGDANHDTRLSSVGGGTGGNVVAEK